MHVLGRWEEAREPRENPHIHAENMQTPHREDQLGFEPGTFLLGGDRADHEGHKSFISVHFNKLTL